MTGGWPEWTLGSAAPGPEAACGSTATPTALGRDGPAPPLASAAKRTRDGADVVARIGPDVDDVEEEAGSESPVSWMTASLALAWPRR